MVDFYKLLGVKRDASTQEIKTAYREMAKKYHPDINKDEEASKIIISLNEAKETLLDDDKRREYDSLLDEIEHSKQFSKDRSETYSAKTKEYKETYSDTYVTKWQFYVNYLKNGIDNTFIKFIKSILVFINYLLFLSLKIISYIVIFLIDIANDFIDYIAGFLIILGLLSLIFLAGQEEPDYISFLPANIEGLCLFSFVAISIELIKELIIKGSINLYVVLQNIENKLFVAILMK